MIGGGKACIHTSKSGCGNPGARGCAWFGFWVCAASLQIAMIWALVKRLNIKTFPSSSATPLPCSFPSRQTSATRRPGAAGA